MECHLSSLLLSILSSSHFTHLITCLYLSSRGHCAPSCLVSSLSLRWSNSFNLLTVFQHVCVWEKVLRMIDVLKFKCTVFMSSRGLAGLVRFSSGCEYEYQPGIWRVGCLISVCVGSQLSRMLYSPKTTRLCVRVAVCIRTCCVRKFGSCDRPKDELDCTSAKFGDGIMEPLLGFMWCVSRRGLVRGNLLSCCLSNNPSLPQCTIVSTKINHSWLLLLQEKCGNLVLATVIKKTTTENFLHEILQLFKIL